MPATFTEIGTLITRNPALRGGRPIIAGTGTCVRTIAIENNRGLSPEEIAAERPPLAPTFAISPLSIRRGRTKAVRASPAERSFAASCA